MRDAYSAGNLDISVLVAIISPASTLPVSQTDSTVTSKLDSEGSSDIAEVANPDIAQPAPIASNA